MIGQILKGKDVAEALGNQLNSRAIKLKKHGIEPGLGIIRVGQRPDDISYEKGITKRALYTGVKVYTREFPEDATEQEVLGAINLMNNDENIHGIMIFRPLPSHIDDNAIRKSLNPEKDIDGITDMSMAGIYAGSDIGFSPCTPSAVIEILKHYNIEISGKKAVVLGRSLVIGKPVSMMLLNENATVSMCHTKTENLMEVCQNADILVTAVGSARFITKEYTNAAQTIIDVGINVDENGKLCGDVDFDDVLDKCRAITPVPGGVGAVTSCILVKHVIMSAEAKLLAQNY